MRLGPERSTSLGGVGGVSHRIGRGGAHLCVRRQVYRRHRSRSAALHQAWGGYPPARRHWRQPVTTQDTHSRCTRLANVRGMEWVVFLDADEFAVPQDTRLSLPQALLPFTANQLCLLPERHLFGSCGRTCHAALELETYTHRKVSTPACHACSKGTTSERTRVPPPKLFINLKLWKSGLMAVSSFGVWSQVCAPQSASVVRVHHYLRSLEDYQRRMRATLLLTSQRLTLGRFFDPSADAHCDLHMEPYFDPLREMLRMEERPAKADRCTPCPTMATAQRGQRSPEVK
eukprot:TRINITY_DN15028_c0_g1_i1.p1 TRINITY_DN15028_c0_g1~~TRINITY_DN15028_c0_g1_i1.p1  ORF type:complete len:288 (+),score=17.07 TRINITY_DN15028_c0_g1_i1:264-1127(+)